MTDADLMTRDEPETEPGREIATRSPPGPPATQMLDVIARAAADPRCDVEKMKELLAMQERLMANQARQAFNEAMARLQPKLPRLKKNGEATVTTKTGGTYKFRYAKWEDVDFAIRDLLNDEGFSLSFNTEQDAAGITVIGALRHKEGHVEISRLGPLPADMSGGKNPVQAIVSTTSYGKRITATNLLNLTTEGEDDNGGGVIDNFIDENSVSQIGALLKETDSNLTKFLENFGIIEVGEMRQSQYPRAINMLLAKKRRMADEASR